MNKKLLSLILLFVFCCCLLSLFTGIYNLVGFPVSVQGVSMLPTYKEGQTLFVSRILHFNRGDIIVFNTNESHNFKRIIGIPGDKIMINEGSVYINDKKLEEPYLPSNTYTSAGSFLDEGEVKTVPELRFFVLGDNRSNSHDSRYSDIGFVNSDKIEGGIAQIIK